MTACTGSPHADDLVGTSRRATSDHEVLAAVIEALGTAGQGDWAVLEAWVAAVTMVTWAALRAVPEELHDFF